MDKLFYLIFYIKVIVALMLAPFYRVGGRRFIMKVREKIEWDLTYVILLCIITVKKIKDWRIKKHATSTDKLKRQVLIWSITCFFFWITFMFWSFLLEVHFPGMSFAVFGFTHLTKCQRMFMYAQNFKR